MKLHTDTFLSAKHDNDLKIFFVNNPDHKFFLFQYLQENVHSYTSVHFIWTISRLDWWNTFCETAYRHFFWHKFWQRHEYFFFVANPGQNFFLFQNPLGWVHSYSCPHFIWTSSWLDWKRLFVILHTDNFWAQKLTTTWRFFSWTTQITNSFCCSTY